MPTTRNQEENGVKNNMSVTEENAEKETVSTVAAPVQMVNDPIQMGSEPVQMGPQTEQTDTDTV
ncbi:hypothetical protein PR001_g4366 [Phytophthora rubi]|uniref:Uncharacterized protein n=1 Tax=Phytophthora rubi TaxID=129364 RepID=A0A6A3NUR1_9STRA|nr:hypothetical protein PR002_g6053 [Phytophthora rubi]KAE9047018.1 hypothetical protein PR001_g4366 [Phytophthora rubi]